MGGNDTLRLSLSNRPKLDDCLESKDVVLSISVSSRDYDNPFAIRAIAEMCKSAGVKSLKLFFFDKTQGINVATSLGQKVPRPKQCSAGKKGEIDRQGIDACQKWIDTHGAEDLKREGLIQGIILQNEIEAIAEYGELSAHFTNLSGKDERARDDVVAKTAWAHLCSKITALQQEYNARREDDMSLPLLPVPKDKDDPKNQALRDMLLVDEYKRKYGREPKFTEGMSKVAYHNGKLYLREELPQYGAVLARYDVILSLGVKIKGGIVDYVQGVVGKKYSSSKGKFRIVTLHPFDATSGGHPLKHDPRFFHIPIPEGERPHFQTPISTSPRRAATRAPTRQEAPLRLAPTAGSRSPTSNGHQTPPPLEDAIRTAKNPAIVGNLQRLAKYMGNLLSPAEISRTEARMAGLDNGELDTFIKQQLKTLRQAEKEQLRLEIKMKAIEQEEAQEETWDGIQRALGGAETDSDEDSGNDSQLPLPPPYYSSSDDDHTSWEEAGSTDRSAQKPAATRDGRRLSAPEAHTAAGLMAQLSIMPLPALRRTLSDPGRAADDASEEVNSVAAAEADPPAPTSTSAAATTNGGTH